MSQRFAVLLALIVAVGGACSDDKKPQAVDKFVHDLREGDCFTGSPRPAPKDVTGDKRTELVVTSLPCKESHEREVFAVFEHPAKPGPFPGEKEVSKVAQDGCADRFEGYVGERFGESDLRVAVIAPGQANWGKDDRTIVCTLAGNKALKGSKKKA